MCLLKSLIPIDYIHPMKYESYPLTKGYQLVTHYTCFVIKSFLRCLEFLILSLYILCYTISKHSIDFQWEKKALRVLGYLNTLFLPLYLLLRCKLTGRCKDSPALLFNVYFSVGQNPPEVHLLNSRLLVKTLGLVQEISKNVGLREEWENKQWGLRHSWKCEGQIPSFTG